MTPVEEVLQTWREAERVLDTLRPVTPDHESVRLAIARLKDTYQQLTDLGGHSADVIASTRGTLEETHALLGRVRAIDPALGATVDEPAFG